MAIAHHVNSLMVACLHNEPLSTLCATASPLCFSLAFECNIAASRIFHWPRKGVSRGGRLEMASKRGVGFVACRFGSAARREVRFREIRLVCAPSIAASPYSCLPQCIAFFSVVAFLPTLSARGAIVSLLALAFVSA